jgi:hypothetical protein
LTAALTEKAPPTDSRLGVCVLRGGGLRLQLIDEVDVLVATGDYQSIYLFFNETWKCHRISGRPLMETVLNVDL